MTNLIIVKTKEKLTKTLEIIKEEDYVDYRRLSEVLGSRNYAQGYLDVLRALNCISSQEKGNSKFYNITKKGSELLDELYALNNIKGEL